MARVLIGLILMVALGVIVGLQNTIQAKVSGTEPGPTASVAVERQRHAAITRTPRLDVEETLARLDRSTPSIADRVRAAAPVAPASGSDPLLATQERYELRSAEKLSVRAQGYAELSGDYRVNVDGTISVPVLGRIAIGTLTASEFELVLAERIARVTGREAHVAVEISEWKHVIVTGYVKQPSTTPWVPGMTVLHALSVAGGMFRSSGEYGSTFVSADLEMTRLRKATSELKRLLAEIARLKAERDEQMTIELSQELVDVAGLAEAKQLTHAQQLALESRRAGTEAQIAALQRSRAVAMKELEGLRDQGDRVKELLAVRRDYKQKIDGLQSKGIVRADRSMEELFKVSDLEDRATTIAVGVARIQGTIAALDRDLVGLTQDRRAFVYSEILKLEREAAQARIDFDASRVSYHKLTGQSAPNHVPEREAGRALLVEYEIVREEQGVARARRVDQFARMRPGDVLIVHLQTE